LRLRLRCPSSRSQYTGGVLERSHLIRHPRAQSDELDGLQHRFGIAADESPAAPGHGAHAWHVSGQRCRLFHGVRHSGGDLWVVEGQRETYERRREISVEPPNLLIGVELPVQPQSFVRAYRQSFSLCEHRERVRGDLDPVRQRAAIELHFQRCERSPGDSGIASGRVDQRTVSK